MLTVAWNTTGFHVLAALPKSTKVNASYYTNEVLERIKEWKNLDGARRARRLVFHADNVRSHPPGLSLEFLAVNGMSKAPHPPSTLDLGPSDFCLFGEVK
jgi:hypothetical protein